MLRITACANAEAAKQYYTQGLSRSDYYIDGQEAPGRWHGTLAAQLGLSGEVDRESYFALCDNRHPKTGQRLTARDKENRRVGYDFTFSVPKDVSVLYELTQDERILKAFRDSVRETMAEIETETKTRVRAGGKDEDRTTGSLAYAEFTHFTSRPVGGIPAPHLHSHCYVFNATFDQVEKRFKAAQVGDLKRDAPYYEAAFDARLAHRLEGLGIRTAKNPDYSFRLADLPKSITDKFSQRRNQIEAKAAALGVTSASGKHAIGYFNRENKTLEVGKAELRKEWNSWLDSGERRAISNARTGVIEPTQRITHAQAVEYAVAHSFVRHSTLSEKRLKAEALHYGVGSVLPEGVAAALDRHATVIRVKRDGELIATTQDVLASEMRLFQFVRGGRGQYLPFATDTSTLAGLSDEQTAAAQHVLNSRDRVTGIRGGAGTGKTTLMRKMIAAIEAGDPSGRRRVGIFAPSGQAARSVLRDKEKFVNADTLQRFLLDTRMQETLRGQPILVDEAGLVSTLEMDQLADIARRNNNRIIVVGDYHQHRSVEAGDIFRLMESEGGARYAELTQILRQRSADYRKAVEYLAKGNREATLEGFKRLDDLGAIVEVDGASRHRVLAKDYAAAVGDGAETLVIAPTHAEGRAVTDAIRAELKAHGRVGTDRKFVGRESTGWTDPEKQDSRNYRAGLVIEFHQATAGQRFRTVGARKTVGGFHKGEAVVVSSVERDRVAVVRADGATATLPLDQAARFRVFSTVERRIAKGDRLRILKNGIAVTANGRERHISNGDVATVEGFNKAGDLKLSNGVILPKTYGHFDLGYVETSNSSQGKTVDRVFVSIGDASLPAARADQMYVSASRARDSVRVYVEDKAEVRRAVARSGERLSAVELLKSRPKTARSRLNVRETLERTRLARYVRDKVERYRETRAIRIAQSKEARRG